MDVVADLSDPLDSAFALFEPRRIVDSTVERGYR